MFSCTDNDSQAILVTSCNIVKTQVYKYRNSGGRCPFGKRPITRRAEWGVVTEVPGAFTVEYSLTSRLLLRGVLPTLHHPQSILSFPCSHLTIFPHTTPCTLVAPPTYLLSFPLPGEWFGTYGRVARWLRVTCISGSPLSPPPAAPCPVVRPQSPRLTQLVCWCVDELLTPLTNSRLSKTTPSQGF